MASRGGGSHAAGEEDASMGGRKNGKSAAVDRVAIGTVDRVAAAAATAAPQPEALRCKLEEAGSNDDICALAVEFMAAAKVPSHQRVSKCSAAETN